MKIGLVLDHYDPQRGGVEQWTNQFAGRLLCLGHEAHVVASGFGPQAEKTGVVPHQFVSQGSRVQNAEKIEDVLKGIDLDVIHDMGVGWYCDLFQPHGGSRNAAFEQNLLLQPAWRRPFKKFSQKILPRYRDYDRLLSRQYSGEQKIYLALSEMVRNDLHRFHGVRDKQIRLIYNGVNSDRFSPTNCAVHRESIRGELGLRDEVLFLIVAHNLKLKGVPALLRAAKTLATTCEQNLVPSSGLPEEYEQTAQPLKGDSEKFHIAIVGGKRTGPFRKMAERLGVGKKVTFVGAVGDAVPYYAAADVYVQPTFYDPCSLVVLEALSCGLPVVTTRFNGASELMTEHKHGYVLNDPGDADVLAAQMWALLHSERREQMSVAARQLAKEHSFERNVDQILEVYREVAESKSSAQRGPIAA